MDAMGVVRPRVQMSRPHQGSEPQAKAVEAPDDDASPAASVQRFVENSDEMAASLRSQFRSFAVEAISATSSKVWQKALSGCWMKT